MINFYIIFLLSYLNHLLMTLMKLVTFLISLLQCFDTPSLYMEQRSDSGVSITSNQNGPPPSYEAVVALDGIRKCSNVNCPLGKTMNIDDDTCGGDINKNGLTIEDMEPTSNDDGELDHNDKYYGDKCNDDNLGENLICQRCATRECSPNQSNNNLCDCNNLIGGVVSTVCRNCGEILDGDGVAVADQIDGNNKCYYNYMTSVSNPNGQIIDDDNLGATEQDNNNVEMLNSVNNNNMGAGDDVNDNINGNGLSNDTTTTTATSDDTNDNNNNATVNTGVDLQQINENGIIRLDMSQIIDSTGLPTYEAAIKLEQSGYV